MLPRPFLYLAAHDVRALRVCFKHMHMRSFYDALTSGQRRLVPSGALSAAFLIEVARVGHILGGQVVINVFFTIILEQMCLQIRQ